MKTPWLKLSLFSLTLALGASCATINNTFCETDDECPASFACDTEAHQCVAIPEPDAGDGPDDPDDIADAGAARSCNSFPGQQCVKAAPDGWSGPIAKAEAGALEDVAGCSGDYAIDAGLFGADIACECECGSPTSLSCGNASLREWTSNEISCEIDVCGVFGSTCLENTQSLSEGQCTGISSALRDEPRLQMRPGLVLGGTCGQPDASGELGSSFDGQTQLCGAELDSVGCGSDEVCAPNAGAEFSGGLCVMQAGIHECPADVGYTEQTIVFTGIDDNRACDSGTCSCQAPTGSLCGGKIELFDGGPDKNTCGAPLTTLARSEPLTLEDEVCDPLPSNANAAVYSVDLQSNSCEVNGQASTAGDVVGTGATTVCCMP
jgi:hypothetical protein